MKIATLGPEGTFSHEAVREYDDKATIVFTDTIREIFELISKTKASLGFVPVENSISGTVNQTLDYLNEFRVKIKAEIVLPITHHLAGFGKISQIKFLYVQPQTYEQCEIFIRKNLPKAEIIQTLSNGKSAEIVAKSRDKKIASIVPKIAVKIYKLKVLKKIQDSKINVTRFFIIAKSDSKKTRHDKTSIAVYPKKDRPGLLYNLLGEFAKRNINLTKIESRPSKNRLGEYIFYMDFEGHKSDKNAIETLKKIEQMATVKVLGSYPREN